MDSPCSMCRNALQLIFDPIISYFYDMLILGKPMAQLKIAWSVTTTGVNAVISVIAATIVYVALRPVLIKANLFFKIGKENNSYIIFSIKT